MNEAPLIACRSCHAPLERVFVDLGLSPISNALRPYDALEPENFFRLRAFACDVCRLVQLQDLAPRETHFHADYAYFSSFSDSWLAHAKRFAIAMIDRLHLDADSQVVEIASNDGYLLQYFKEGGVPVLGIDPAANCAEVAIQRGVPTIVRFFGVELANELVAAGQGADLIVANNVLAHVPDLNDFVGGWAILLKPGGTITIEFPHLLELIERNYFDTVYHEHYSYLSLVAIEHLLARHGLAVFDVEIFLTHGGSLRVFAARLGESPSPSAAVHAVRERERAAGLNDDSAYARFDENTRATKRALLKLFIDIKESGKTIAGYGAPAKAATLVNYCGIGTDFLDFTVDRNPRKQDHLLPGTTIPIFAPEHIFEARPDFLVILPWNLKDEVIEQMAGIREWGGQFIVPLPIPAILP